MSRAQRCCCRQCCYVDAPAFAVAAVTGKPGELAKALAEVDPATIGTSCCALAALSCTATLTMPRVLLMQKN
jgi:hypothetical protein